ncbi:unnamed protein product [Periconia digitata]|uniref:Uncharacterized protein n=1 Tax=Periconia digitata TaxID=1303443 RepID=A0A9W4UBA8_9PLEO|nr:unnamed protein product [Periconia digitata]
MIPLKSHRFSVTHLAGPNMFNTGIVLAALIHISVAQELLYDLVNSILVPKLKSDFAKNNVSAQWAPSYPKEWGSEDLQFQFNDPMPDEVFSGVLTDDGRYLAMLNGTHVRFLDIDLNTTVTTFSLGLPANYAAQHLVVRSTPEGGYDVFADGAKPLISVDSVFRRQLYPDLTLTSETPIAYKGALGTFSKQGKMALTPGSIHDLNTPNSPAIILEGQTSVTDLNFNPNGTLLSTVNWNLRTADLWNATTGAKIFAFPDAKAQNWRTLFSPDGKYIAIALGSGNRSIQIYATENLAAKPITLTGFKDWPRVLEWSQSSSFLAVGDPGRLQVFGVPDGTVLQTWELESTNNGVYSVDDVHWVDGDRKILFAFRYAVYVYDFEKNLKRWITPRVTDHMWTEQNLKVRVGEGEGDGILVSGDPDGVARGWKL